MEQFDPTKHTMLVGADATNAHRVQVKLNKKIAGKEDRPILFTKVKANQFIIAPQPSLVIFTFVFERKISEDELRRVHVQRGYTATIVNHGGLYRLRCTPTLVPNKEPWPAEILLPLFFNKGNLMIDTVTLYNRIGKHAGEWLGEEQ